VVVRLPNVVTLAHLALLLRGSCATLDRCWLSAVSSPISPGWAPGRGLGPAGGKGDSAASSTNSAASTVGEFRGVALGDPPHGSLGGVTCRPRYQERTDFSCGSMRYGTYGLEPRGWWRTLPHTARVVTNTPSPTGSRMSWIYLQESVRQIDKCRPRSPEFTSWWGQQRTPRREAITSMRNAELRATNGVLGGRR